jgi:DNA-binding NarL/FixJ family response regulator
MQPQRPLEVLLIDDDEAVTDLLETMIDLDDRFRLVASSRWAAHGIVLAHALKPDVVVLDLQLPGMDGHEALPLLRRACTGVIVVFSAFPDPHTLLSVLGSGADAYVDKAQTWAELLPTILNACAMTTPGDRARSG